MDNWLKTASFVKSTEKIIEQTTASSLVPDLGLTVKAIYDLARKEKKICHGIFPNEFLFHPG